MADANASNKQKTAPALDEKALAESKKKEAQAQAAADKAKLEKEKQDRKAAEQEAKRRAAANATQDPVNNESDAPDEPGDPGDTVPEDEDVTGEKKNPIKQTVTSPENPSGNVPAPNVELQRGVTVVGSEEAETITAPNQPNLQQSGAPARAARPSRPERRSDLQVLIDALPDELYDAFVKPYNLNSRGVDEETGFDLRKVDNPTLDSIRINLRQQGYFV